MFRFFIFAGCICLIDGRIRTRITGGHSIDIERAPYQVSIFDAKEDGQHICGGSIISKDYVLTASHCFRDHDVRYSIRSGSKFWARGGTEHRITKLIRHDHFLRKNSKNDIALVKVFPAFEINNVTRKIVELYNQDETIGVGDEGFICGWGDCDDFGEDRPDKLQGLKVNVIDMNVCKQKYILNRLHDDLICASNDDSTKNFCSGDSGGPLVINGRQAGIICASGGFCASSDYPGLYTSVPDYRDWIDEQIKN